MTQKIIKVGNSSAVVIPREFMKKSGWKPGDEVVVEADRVSEGLGVYSVNTNNPTSRTSVTPEFFDWLNKFHKKYGSALQQLAKK